jgi:hypothetical protein
MESVIKEIKTMVIIWTNFDRAELNKISVVAVKM